MVEEAHLLVEQAVDDVRPGVLPLDQADQLAVQRGTQVHRPVVTVQSHLERQWQTSETSGKHPVGSDSGGLAEGVSLASVASWSPFCPAH